MILYYMLIAFAGLMILFISINLLRTKKLVSPHSPVNKRKLWALFLEKTADLKNKWLNYFTGNNPDNLVRNLIITLFIGVALLGANYQLIQWDNKLVIAGYIVIVLLVVWLWGKRQNRKIFEESFPEVIQVVNAAISAGIGLMQALERCGENIQGPIGQEFKNVYRRLAIGEDVDSVFLDSYKRYPYKEYYYFITIIKLNMSRGGQLKEVISRLARLIADSKKMEKRKMALTSEARMSAMIVACFPVGFMIFMRFMMPNDFEFLLNNPTGRLIFYYVVGSEVLGLFIIWLLMRRAT